ncbi:glycoside hydrolase family 53 protein [Flavobacterium zepuense]|nr:glycosyl hydrolase 53 family protein [Flavobacterium zepuense]
MKKIFSILIPACMALAMFISCGGDDSATDPVATDDVVTDDVVNDDVIPEDTFIRAVDMSFLPETEGAGTVYYNGSTAQDALATLKDAGVNTIRIRLWKDPATAHSGMAEVKALAQKVKAAGMKVWLTVHYSDTWADPANQIKPQAWEGLAFAQLKAAAVTYTQQILTEVNPDIIQIGNETNSGFIYPEGNLVDNEAGFLELVNAVSATIREQSPQAKIMLHYAGIAEGADWFFNKTANVDFDYIGLSYYPIWHGKSIPALQNKIAALKAAHNKEVIVAETSYPFTLGWEDWTNNVVGLDSQIIPAYPATPQGQKDFLLAVRNAVEVGGGLGFCYWGAEWVAFRGSEATNGSTWENQALWDFDNKAVPALEAFNF